jgi:type I restriction-modification system DNA methylase subunit
MDTQSHNQIVSFIWSIADDCLRDVYVRGKYRDVILPMVVIRRLDAVLEDTKEQVLKMKENFDVQGVAEPNEALCYAAKQSFCNWSPFRLRDLTSRATQQKLKADFIMGGKKGVLDTRFAIPFAGDAEFSMLPRVSDGQLLFLLNNVSKMKETTELGSRIVEVHNGSSLFTGDAGGGESNARRYMIERDLVEAIIAL